MIKNYADSFDMTPKGIINEVIEPPQVVVPMLGQENTITFVVETYDFIEVANNY